MPDVEVIIPFSMRTHRCGSNLQWVVRRIQALSKGDTFRITVVHNDEKEVEPLVSRVRWLHLNGPFNKAWACNYGFRLAESQGLAFIDADIVLPEGSLEGAARCFKDGYQGGKLIRGCWDLDMAESDLVLFSDPKILTSSIQAKNGKLRGGNRTGGAFFVTGQAYQDACGFNEAFAPLGGVDSDLSQRLAVTAPKWVGARESGYHLYHERSDNRERNQALAAWSLSQKSQALLDYIEKLPNDFGDPEGPRGYRPEDL